MDTTDVAAGANAGPQGGGADTPPEEEKITLNKREMRLGLRHRDSFAVHKSHIQHAHAAGASKEAAISAALTGPAKSQSSVAGVLQQAGAISSRSSGSEASTAFDAESPRSDDDGGDDGALEEGGANDEDGAVTVNPDSEADILAALEALAGNTSSAAIQAGSVAAEDGNAPRRKNRLKSMVKGVASALGLRKSRRKREAEAARRAAEVNTVANAAGGAAGGVGPAAGGAPPALLSPSAKPMTLHRSHSSAAIVGEHEHLAGATVDDLAALSVGKAIARPIGNHVTLNAAAAQASAAALGSARRSVPSTSSLSSQAADTSWEEHEPARDEAGAFMPCHRKEVRVPSILKGSAMTRKALAAAAAAATASGSPGAASESGSEAGFVPPSPGLTASNFSLGPAAGMGSVSLGPSATPKSDASGQYSSRRGIVFADQTGKALAHVHFSEMLHYGEYSEHEDWEDEEEQGGKCAIM